MKRAQEIGIINGRYAEVASVTTLYEASRAVGGAVGNAISGAIWTNLLILRLHKYLPAHTQSAAVKIQNSFVVATSYAPGSPERIAINRSYTEVMRLLLIPSLAVLTVSFLIGFVMENVDLKEIDRNNCQGAVIGTSRFGSWLPNFLKRRGVNAGGNGQAR